MAVNNNVGWAFPVRVNADGRTATVGGSATEVPTVQQLDAAVQTGAYLILVCGKSERVMLGQFGVGADRYLYQPMGYLMTGFLEADIREQINWFCGRATPGSVSAIMDNRNAEVVMGVELRHNAFGGESILKIQVGRT